MVVPTLEYHVIQEMMSEHTEFLWFEWHDLDRLTEIDANLLPQDCTAVVYSGLYELDRQEAVSQLLKRSGVSVVSFGPTFEEMLATAYRLYHGREIEYRPKVVRRSEFSEVMDVPADNEERTLIVGFDPKDFSDLVNGSQLFRWWTIQDAESGSVVREVKENRVRFIIFNEALSEFHRSCQKEAVRRYLSSESMVEVSSREEVRSLITEILPKREVRTKSTTTDFETMYKQLELKYQQAVRRNQELEQIHLTLGTKVASLAELLEELEQNNKS